jgi:hypothetical protein
MSNVDRVFSAIQAYLKTVVFSLILGTIWAPTASATPIGYQVIFTVDAISNISPVFDNDLSTFVSPPFMGQQFYATLRVDDAILATDGPANAGQLLSFSSRIAESFWRFSAPSSYFGDFQGFRGPCWNPALNCGEIFTKDIIGFEVIGGVVVGLWGGVYGGSDVPYIDFNGNRFSSLTMFDINVPPDAAYAYAIQPLSGTLSISRIPEPASLSLLLIAMFSLRAAARGWKAI